MGGGEWLRKSDKWEQGERCFQILVSVCSAMIECPHGAHNFQNTMSISTGLSDLHEMVVTVVFKSSLIKLNDKGNLLQGL